MIDILAEIEDALRTDRLMAPSHRILLVRALDELRRLRAIEDDDLDRRAILARFEDESG